MSPDHLRLEMCQIAVEGAPGIEVDDREITRQGPTYTIDTLESFAPDEELFLIVGSDAAAGLSTWHRWEEIANRVAVVVAPRPGSDVDVPGAILIEMGLLDVSGTDIRRRAAEGRPFRYLVTAPVHDFIVANDLYTDLVGDDMVQGSSMPEDQS